MAITYEPIATTTLGTAVNTITFSSISSAYTDLKLILVGSASVASTTVYLRFNNDTATNYSYTEFNSNGATVSSARGSTVAQILTRLMPTAQPGFIEFDVFSYAGSTFKSVLAKGMSDQNGSGNVVTTTGMWRSTAAITRIDLVTDANTFNIGTTATIYGILKA